MLIRKLFPSGMWEVSAVIGGYLVRRRYQGYTKKEAFNLFKDEFKVD